MKKLIIILTLTLTLNCVYYVPVMEVDNADPDRAIEVLTNKGYTDIYITGECWHKPCASCFSTGFVARLNDTVVVGCVEESVYEYGMNPVIKLEK